MRSSVAWASLRHEHTKLFGRQLFYQISRGTTSEICPDNAGTGLLSGRLLIHPCYVRRWSLDGEWVKLVLYRLKWDKHFFLIINFCIALRERDDPNRNLDAFGRNLRTRCLRVWNCLVEHIFVKVILTKILKNNETRLNLTMTKH